VSAISEVRLNSITAQGGSDNDRRTSSTTYNDSFS
jgi:hypothetical protein